MRSTPPMICRVEFAYMPSRSSSSFVPSNPSANGAFVIFQLVHDLQTLTSASFGQPLDPICWRVLHQLWVAHLIGRDLYIGDLLDPQDDSDKLQSVIRELTDLGLLDLRQTAPSVETRQPCALSINLTAEGIERSRALATDLLRTIHEHCSLAGINPFARRAPAWADLSIRPQSRSNRRSRHHRRQS